MARPRITHLLLGSLLLLSTQTHADDFERGMAALEQGYAQIAIELWKPLAEIGNPEAQFGLGVIYNDAMGVPQDYSEANYWFLRAADQGYAPAQYNLGNAYKYGTGMQQDDGMAVIWWRKAAEADFGPAQYNLGSALLEGSGVPRDRKEGLHWYQRAADNGHPMAKDYLEREGVGAGTADLASTTVQPSTTAQPASAVQPGAVQPGAVQLGAVQPATPKPTNEPAIAAQIKPTPTPAPAAEQARPAPLDTAPPQPAAQPATAPIHTPVHTPLHTQSSAPAPEVRSAAADDPCQQWLAQDSGNEYTLQLMAARETDSVTDFLRRQSLEPAPVICTYPTSDGTLHAVVYGQYPTAKAARKALAELPENLRIGGAYLRRLQVLRHATARSPDQ